MAYFDIRYLREPSINRGAALGQGVAAIGDSLTKLGELGHAREKLDADLARQARAEKMEADKFDWLKNMDTKNYGLKEKELNYDILKGDRSYGLEKQKLDHTIFKDNRDYNLGVAKLNAELTEQGRKRIEDAEKAKAEREQDAIGIAAMRKKFPNATKGMSDDEIKFFVKKNFNSLNDMEQNYFKPTIPVDSAIAQTMWDEGVVTQNPNGGFYISPLGKDLIKTRNEIETRQMEQLGNPDNRLSNIKTLVGGGMSFSDASARVDKAIEWKKKNPNAKFNSSLDSDMDDGAN
ncbi:hypothetical protein [uncultured Campylobacter sp.]|uniref:hypothetical protein n=1 Tax=uncultured Campylobacter sp. TaxID=218934 RepID=UPI0026064193|nr:hypothetical protein [uncultured Campylobacter sp.]